MAAKILIINEICNYFMLTLLKDRVIKRRFMTKDRVMKGHFMTKDRVMKRRFMTKDRVIMGYLCLIREKVVTFRMVKLNLLLSIFCITK